MLNAVLPADFRWNRLQEPAHSSSQPADLMRLLSALDMGWKIHQPVSLWTHAGHDQAREGVYQIWLRNPANGETREMFLAHQERVENFLAQENIIVVAAKAHL